MTICEYSKSHYCRSACCYIANKRVLPEEVESLGLENVVKRGDKYFLKNKKEFWAGGVCVFLDEETSLCDINYKLPFFCSEFNCYGYPGFDEFWQEVRHFRKKRGLTPP